MNENNINRFLKKHVRVYLKGGRTFYTGNIKDVNSNATTIKDKFDRLVTIENEEIISISEWN